MRIYPAIDIKDGNCVRLFKGRFDDVTVYGTDPVAVAKRWEEEGAEFIHVVDLDGALKGRGVNSEVIRNICKSVNVPVQTGGGIRTMEDIQFMLECGVARVIIGTSAVRNIEFVKEAVKKYGEKIVIGIDAKDSMVAIEGWEEVSTYKALDFAREMEKIGVKTIVYTDIATDGTLRGPNVEAMIEMSENLNIDVIASGGVGNEEHLIELSKTKVEGAIVGKALYTGNVELKSVLEKVK